MNNTPRLATHQHCRCYYRLRTIVRIVFWAAAALAALYVAGVMQRHGLLPDDFQDTKDSLFPKR